MRSDKIQYAVVARTTGDILMLEGHFFIYDTEPAAVQGLIDIHKDYNPDFDMVIRKVCIVPL